MIKLKRFKTAFFNIYTFDDDIRAVIIIFYTIAFKQGDKVFRYKWLINCEAHIIVLCLFCITFRSNYKSG